MKTYLIDWGEKDVSGSRYAIIEAENKEDLLLGVDEVGNTSSVRFMEVNNDGDSRFYVELSNEAYTHEFNEKIEWNLYGGLYSDEEIPDVFERNKGEWQKLEN